jgi:RNA polymerase sigma-70 factor (ECF subfamily)
VQSSEKDLALIDRILTGDASAYRELTNRHKDYAYTVAFRIVGNREDAQEIAQDAFMRAFKALEYVQPRSQVHHVVLPHRVQRRSRALNASTACPRRTWQKRTTPHWGLPIRTDAMKQRERQHYIEQALQHLSPTT